MKIKSDFVTNSSTSSFVVMGVSIEPCMVNGFDEDGDHWEFFEDKLKGSGLEFSFGSEGSYADYVMIGIYWERMDEDETKREFRARVKAAIKDTLGIDAEPGHIEEAWEDR